MRQSSYTAQTLAGYDWVQKNLAQSYNLYGDLQSHDGSSTKLGVCGELIGGSLAAMLALTECYQTSLLFGRQGSSAALLGNPIVDWTALFEVEAENRDVRPSSRRKLDQEPPDSSSSTALNGMSIAGLKEMRSTLFKKPEAYFDPFASPLLFFRTPSSELPDEPSPLSLTGRYSELEAEEIAPEPGKKRRSLRKYPPTGSNLTLPYLRLEAGKQNPLRPQGNELINLMQRSQGRSTEEVDANRLNSSERFELVEKAGLGLWNNRSAFEIGQWFAKALRRP